MKPEIISTGVGYHNSDLPKSTLRIVQGGSWKKQRVVVIVPSADMIAAKVASAPGCNRKRIRDAISRARGTFSMEAVRSAMMRLPFFDER